MTRRATSGRFELDSFVSIVPQSNPGYAKFGSGTRFDSWRLHYQVLVCFGGDLISHLGFRATNAWKY